jgi:hypothetical protein
MFILKISNIYNYLYFSTVVFFTQNSHFEFTSLYIMQLEEIYGRGAYSGQFKLETTVYGS